MAATFLTNLPIRIPESFTKTKFVNKTEKALHDVIPVTLNVPISDSEKNITNDRKPYLLRYLEKNYGAQTAPNDEKAGSSKTPPTTPSKGMKRKESETGEAGSSHTKTRRVV